METVDGLTARELTDLIHAHAASMMVADIRLKPAQAIRRAADLATLTYNQMHLTRVLRDAAASYKVPGLLADLVAPRGGASLALAADADIASDEQQ